MNTQELSDLSKYSWMPSRIPACDALSTFVPDPPKWDPAILETSRSRWHPVQGGHQVLIPYDGGEYDASYFTINPCAWDHEHCEICGKHIPAMTLCYVTKPGQPYLLLCVTCHEDHVTSKQRTRSWWKFWQHGHIF